ncbi:MAG: hypothetical protein Q4F79_01505 [Eubacteriales bacterium]|nr:hypothetical protein [Eubacteriales bacterium]
MQQDVREINLEIGKPAVAEALDRMRMELRLSKKRGYAAVKLIHGFGSSGTGGKIRVAVRRELAAMCERGAVRMVIPGEKLTIFEEDTRKLLQICPEFRRDRDLERHNNGITVVVIKKT